MIVQVLTCLPRITYFYNRFTGTGDETSEKRRVKQESREGGFDGSDRTSDSPI